MIRVPPLVIALALALTLGSCAVGPPPTHAPSSSTAPVPAPTATVPVTSESLVAAGLTDSAAIPTSDPMLGVVPCTTPATDRYGSYHPICLPDDAPILQFDPTGPWSWLVTPPGAPLPLDPGYVASAVDQAGRLLVDLIDSPAQWDDSPAAWSGIGSRFGALLNRGADDLRASVASRPERVGMFDLDDWREAWGLRPAAYPAEGPRLRVHDLRTTDIVVGGGRPTTRDDIGVTVTVHARFSQPVLDADGATWELIQSVSLVVSSLEATGAVREIEWSEDHAVGRRLRGGQASLPRLDVDAAVPPGWAPQGIGALTFALPGSSSLAEESVDGATVAWRQFTLDGEGRELYVSGPALMHDPPPEGGWWVVPDFDNYGLDIPGAEVAAAEIGRDELGRFRARVDLQAFEHGSTWNYHVEWDTTPERAEDELRMLVGSMSVTAAGGA
ncbi:hypothetical protein [Cellulomonas sp.]|uniref:hypothetical protein n=1 Tax=Cellulomonas sp. TaxID=40001 RepID=UPI003BA96F28